MKKIILPAAMTLLLFQLMVNITSFSNLAIADTSNIKKVEKVEMSTLLNLKNEEAKLDKEKKKIDAANDLLILSENRMDKKLVNINKKLTELNNKIADDKKSKSKKIKRMTDVYSKMPPNQAAAIIQTLDIKMAAAALRGMDNKKAGKILGSMNPAFARELSIVLLGMN